MALFREGFPRTYEHLRELYQVEDVLVYDPDEDGYKQVHFVISVRRDVAKEKHPAVADWLLGMGPLITARLDVTDEKGRTVATIRFSTKDLALTLDCFVANGKICPVENGKVLVAEGYDVETVAHAQHKDRWTFDLDANGIVTEVHDLVVKVDYTRTQDGMEARFVMDQEPKVRVHGSAYGVIPTWAIDVFIPGNIEELTREFLRVVTRGNEGKGTVIDLSERSGKNGANVAVLDFQQEALNSTLVRIGFKIARRKLIPPQDAVDDLSEYLKKGHAAFEADFDAFVADQR
jgi:hypothetical protein